MNMMNRLILAAMATLTLLLCPTASAQCDTSVQPPLGEVQCPPGESYTLACWLQAGEEYDQNWEDFVAPGLEALCLANGLIDQLNDEIDSYVQQLDGLFGAELYHEGRCDQGIQTSCNLLIRIRSDIDSTREAMEDAVEDLNTALASRDAIQASVNNSINIVSDMHNTALMNCCQPDPWGSPSEPEQTDESPSALAIVLAGLSY